MWIKENRLAEIFMQGKCHDLNIDWGGDLWYFKLIDVEMQ